MTDRFYGPLPPLGARVRHYHPWLEDHAVGTVARIEQLDSGSWWGWEVRDGVKEPARVAGRHRIHLTDCLHWTSTSEWGPVPDTFFDNIAETWEYEDHADE